MKAIRISLRLIAPLTVCTCLAANHAGEQIKYFGSLWAGPNCHIELDSFFICDEGNRSQCTLLTDFGILYLSKTVSDGPCEVVTKSN
jgi:hypothetical protein